MKKIVRFFRNYKLFSIAILAGTVGLILNFLVSQTIAKYLIGVVAIGESLPLVWNLWKDIRTGRYGIDILAATSIITAVILGQEWAGLVIVLMLTGGQSLEDYANRKAQTELDDLLAHAPVTANVIKKGKVVQVKVDDIKVGDKFVVKAGDIVPVDGQVIDGQANFDESSLTGESLLVAKDLKDKLLSGSISADGIVTAKATAIAADSQYQQIIRLVKSAAASRAPFVRLADRYSLPFTLAAYAIGGTVWLLSGQAIRFLEVTIVATPCPLILATPIALISGMARASRSGIIVKNGAALEKLAKTKTIALDKTGTLTKGDLEVSQIVTFGKLSEANLLKLAGSVERNSNHVLAESIVNAARLKGVKLEKTKHIEEIAGLGISATVKGGTVLVGGQGLLKKEGIKLPKKIHGNINATSTYIIMNGQIEGMISFTDNVRKEAKATLRALHNLNIRNIAMITGDHEAAAEDVAQELDIDEVYANQLPADKLHTLSKLRPRPVAFVGDGVNDAPVLTSADVGIALGAKGSTAASESADMVIMLDDLSRVAMALKIAQRTFRIADQSILAGIGLSFILMLVFATGKFTPIVGALCQEVLDVLTIFNALRAHTINPSVK